MSTQRSLQDRLRSRPRVEQLEDRWTPSVTVKLTGNTLDITGTNGSDRIVVYDNGSLFVYENGVNTFFSGSSPVRFVNIRTFGGADTVLYRQISRVQLPAAAPERNIDVDLGDGNDLASLSFVSITASVYNVTVRGGRGNDQLLASAAGRLSAGRSGILLQGAALNIIMNGDEGNDGLDVRSFNDVGFLTSMDVKQFGGEGTDLLIHQYEGRLNGQIDLFQDAGSEGAAHQFDFHEFVPGTDGVYRGNRVIVR